jgi:hypothetical protein
MAIAPAPYVADVLDLDEATAGDRCPDRRRHVRGAQERGKSAIRLSD